ncbi:hypothetical protein C0Q70_21602 [Pomacea canaliculata]|uniref:Serine protease K12H4.7 n=2 Tax=Pomacea canaliculata TaxID=400727 RepID=A0A2T7NCZ5_POMCA|nr:hypothetical protein C0Q70_21602 [Pomacea canaliculata]
MVPPPSRPSQLADSPSSALWFNQTLDHFNDADTRTFMQQYFINDKYYKPGGPVFLSIGGEGPADPVWMENGAWIQYAQDHNAFLFMVEHRFYGKTHPTGNLSVENLGYLTSEQALADLANFITFAQVKYNLPDNKWIAIGGSYSGALAAWFRLKYPHLVQGAVATSAPVFAQLNFLEYMSVVQDSLAMSSSSCVSNIQQATQQLEKLLSDETGRQQLRKMFNLCDDINIANSDDIANLYSVLAGNFEDVVQYNKDNRAFEGAKGTNITIDTLCGIMDTDTNKSALQRYADVNTLMLTTYAEKCQDFTYASMISDLTKIDWDSNTAAGGRQWTYQTCTEFGYFQTSDSKNQPFGSYFPLEFFIKQCQDIFGPKFNADLIQQGINFTNTNYGGYNLKVTNVVFPNGSVDPWHALGIVKDLSPNATAIFIDGTAHCANMYPATPDDPPQLVQARLTISKLIGQWVA